MASEKTEQVMGPEKDSIDSNDSKPFIESGAEAIKITYLNQGPDRLSVKYPMRSYTGAHDTSLQSKDQLPSTTPHTTVPTTSLDGKALEIE